MVQGTPVQLGTFSATQSCDMGRVFMQDSSCCRLLQHCLCGVCGQPLQEGSPCSPGRAERCSRAGLSSQVSGQPGTTKVGLGKSRVVKCFCCSVVVSYWSGHQATEDLCGELVRSMQSIRFGRSRKWSTAIFLKHPLLNSNILGHQMLHNESFSVS